jgi:hypothetical protein
MLRDDRAAGVLAAATSDVRGVATLKDVKLRVKPGTHMVLISAPDAKGIPPAQVRAQLLLDLYTRTKALPICLVFARISRS